MVPTLMQLSPRASLPSLLLLPQMGFWWVGGHKAGTPLPDTHTHTFQRLYPLESQRLENSSYSTIFIFFGYNFSFGHVIN